MLKILRNKKTAKKIWIGLAVIIIPAFAFWGFGGAGRDQDEPAVAGKIFGRNVSNSEFRESLLAVRTLAVMQFGDKLPEIEKYLNFEGQAWERLILLQEAKRRKIKVKDQEVITEIQSAPYFHDKNGFSNKIYQEILRYVLRLQPRVFEEQTRQNLLLSKLYAQVTQNVKITDAQVREEYIKANEELSIYYIASKFEEFAKTIKPSDSQIQLYFEQNKEMFKQPPQDNQPARIPEFTEVKDKVRQAFINATAKAAAERKINECAQNLQQMDFDRAAAASGLKSVSTGFFKSSGLIEDLGPARNFWSSAKQLKDGQPSSIITGEGGYYIIKLKSIKPVEEDQFLKEKEEFSKRALSLKKNEALDQFFNELKKKAQ